MNDLRARLDEANARHNAAAAERRRIINNAIVIALLLAGVSAAFLIRAVPHSHQQERLMQESTAWNR